MGSKDAWVLVAPSYLDRLGRRRIDDDRLNEGRLVVGRPTRSTACCFPTTFAWNPIL
jgi:hypothetical protein